MIVSRPKPWFIGVACFNCARFIPVVEDPLGGGTSIALPRIGSIVAKCRHCRARGVYRYRQVERRQMEQRREA